MRTIETINKREKSEKTKKLVVGMFLVGIMLLSTLGYAAYEWGQGNSGTTITYNGIKFNLDNGLWATTINGVQYTFVYSPNQIEKRVWNVNELTSYSGTTLYVSSDNGEAQQEINRNFYSVASKIQEACLSGESCRNNELPVKDCSNNFIIIQESNNSQIKKENNCVFILGSYENLTAMTDEFILNSLRVIK